MGFVENLRTHIVNPQVDLSTCLREARLLAAKLGNEDFQRWVTSELFGYEDPTSTPPYRKLRVHTLGTFAGPFERVIKNVVLPVHHLPEDLKEYATEVVFTGPVGQLEALCAEKGELIEPWPAEVVMLARDRISMTGGFVLVEARKVIPTHNIKGILETIRNKLLEFILQLEEITPEILSSEEAAAKIPKEKLASMVVTVIYGGQNIVAGGTEFSQHVVQTIKQGDMESLVQHLKHLGVPEPDLQELQEAIASDGKPSGENFGPRVKQWIARMANRVLEGAWQVGLGVGMEFLTRALRQYYGWS